MSSGTVTYEDAVASRLDRLAKEAYDTIANEAERFFACQDAGSTTVIEEGRLVVCRDGSCRYQAVQPYGEGTRTYRQVPVDADWTHYCEEVYAPLKAAASAAGQIPREVHDTAARLDPSRPGEFAATDLQTVRDWLEQQEPEPIAERTVYRG